MHLEILFIRNKPSIQSRKHIAMIFNFHIKLSGCLWSPCLSSHILCAFSLFFNLFAAILSIFESFLTVFGSGYPWVTAKICRTVFSMRSSWIVYLFKYLFCFLQMLYTDSLPILLWRLIMTNFHSLFFKINAVLLLISINLLHLGRLRILWWSCH